LRGEAAESILPLCAHQGQEGFSPQNCDQHVVFRGKKYARGISQIFSAKAPKKRLPAALGKNSKFANCKTLSARLQTAQKN
jgi:hypothetical protein